MLGYEYNILEMPEEVRRDMSEQIAKYKAVEHIIREGDYYNLVSPFADDHAAYYYVTKDRSEILFSLIEKKGTRPRETKPLKIKAVDPSKEYTEVYSGDTFTGKELREGLRLALTGEDDTAVMLYFKEK